jgi:hypothetical protein
MNRTILARRYAPLVAVIGVQLLLVAVVPSTAERQGASGVEAGAGNGYTDDIPGEGESAYVDPVAPGATEAAAAATSAVPGQPGSRTVRTLPGGAPEPQDTVPNQPPGVLPGDTSHCVDGRQWDPTIAYWAPPCVPGKPGAAYPTNGGNTYRGVSAKEIVIVDYVSNYGAEVNAILEAQGNLLKYESAKVLDKAWQTFINARYQLYGRKIRIVTYQGQCQSVPPDKSCLLPEMDTIVKTYQPYAVFWSTTLCSECFAKLAQQGVVAFGGTGFSDKFADDNAPYFWNAGMSSTRVQQHFAEWWCTQMSSKNVPSRRVRFNLRANQAPGRDFFGQPRVLGVISTNDPDNQKTVEEVLYKELEKRCGETITHKYFYEQNINTAATQVAAGIAAMDTPTNPATVVVCLCDSVAPQFVYKGEQDNEYYPENVLADVQNMGNDNFGQTYRQGQDERPTLACPKPARGCAFDGALGITDALPARPPDQMEGVRVYKLGSNNAPLPPSVSGFSATNLGRNVIMMANLIQNTGPNLTPQNMAARASALGSVGGGDTNLPLLSFPKGTWNWVQDVKLVWWNKNQTSPFNNAKGRFTSIGTRYTLGQIPSSPNGPEAPVVADRK